MKETDDQNNFCRVSKPRVFEGGLPVIRENVAGIDLGSRKMQVAGPPLSDGTPELAEFGTSTVQVLKAVEWLKQRGVVSVALESTGVYWIPVIEILEMAGLEVVLVDSRSLRHAPGRKTDWLDCQWIQRLHSCGLLRGCYRPSPAITELRTIARNKAVLASEQGDWLRRMQKVLDEMNVRVHHAVSDIQGTTGMAIIRTIIGGERDPRQLARLRDPRCRQSEEKIAEFLTGNWRSDHLFNLEQCVKMYDLLDERLAAYEEEIQRRLKELTPEERRGQQPPPLPNKERMKAFKRRDQTGRREELFRMAGVDLTSIDGIGVETAEMIVSEYGIDLSSFATEEQFVKHLQLAPRQNISGGKPTGKRKGPPKPSRLGERLRNAAVAVSHTATALASFYRLKSRTKGPGVAAFATARKLAVYVYRLLKYGQAYLDEGQKAFEARYEAIRLRAMKATASQLGYTLIKKEAASA
jgi:transposase